MHCASLGEFEQGRPVLEALKSAYPDYPVVLSFFSPSGYEIRKDYPLADVVTYLPLDTPGKAEEFISAVNPALVLWVKYEYWLNHLSVLQQKQIPVLLISGHFRKSQPFFKWYGGIWRRALSGFDQLFVQHESSLELLQEINLDSKSTVSGDTRFDRVTEIAINAEPIANLGDFTANARVIVAGSTWPKDESILKQFIEKHPQYKLIVVPHEVNDKRRKELKITFPSAVFFSTYTEKKDANERILIIDAIGWLSRIYQYATIAYVGGGFNNGIHNTLEAAVFGKPVLFGTNYKKFKEATDMIEIGCAFSIDKEEMLSSIVRKLSEDETIYSSTCSKSKEYVAQKTGATQHVIDYVKSNLLLTK
jgi:3-deoxy-D-manno-octulosonic-acid transferase